MRCPRPKSGEVFLPQRVRCLPFLREQLEPRFVGASRKIAETEHSDRAARLWTRRWGSCFVGRVGLAASDIKKQQSDNTCKRDGCQTQCQEIALRLSLLNCHSLDGATFEDKGGRLVRYLSNLFREAISPARNRRDVTCILGGFPEGFPEDKDVLGKV